MIGESSVTDMKSAWIIITLTIAGCAFTEILPTAEGPTFVRAISNVTAPVGRDAVLECVVEHLSNYKVAWLQVNTQTILTIAIHVITKNHRIAVTHSDHRAWYLHIKDVKESDQGDYMCQINTDPMLSQVGHLKVVVPPDILDYPTSTDMVVREGSNVSLRCEATGSPAPNIIWKRESGEKIALATDEEVSSVNGPFLNITRVNRLHMGAYLCIASNGVPPTVSKRIMLIVHFQPEIMIQNQLVGAEEGSQTTLECRFEAFPKSINYWMRENNDIISNGEKYEASMSDNLHVDAYKVHMNLTIKEIGPDDYGFYKCLAKNSLGGTDGSIKLYKIDTPTTSPTTTTTTTTTTRPPSTAKIENKRRTRPKSAPTIAPSFNEFVDTSKSTANEKRGAQLMEGPNTDAKTGRKMNDETMQPDKTAQSMSSKSAAIVSFTYSNAAVFVILFTAFLW
ncbi:opioid-binding protein/cell adhesion molecule homolog [Diachasma alloeum]|uniref:opioid-binding protein/cell adhesion molecule homolog n=1 Tax=Diachasma alloeum TaxID=454923 RepID=UPI000738275E|nr:opioid-binding protein/cell adhesion molecule homolog [Diachasma alloeum]